MVESVAGEAFIEVVMKAGPIGFKWARRRLQGKVVVVVGPARAGKTTFIDYLRLGLFDDEHYTVSTTWPPPKTPGFDVVVGRHSKIEVIVRMAVDFPGDIGAQAQAQVVFEQRPHAIIIFTDLTTPIETSIAWLKQFCTNIERLWSANDGRRNRTRVIMVVMNKYDKVAPQVADEQKERFREILEDRLRVARGRMISEIAIMPSTLVTNPEGHKKVDRVIADLVKELAK